MNTLRTAAFAGRFYPGNRPDIIRMLEKLLATEQANRMKMPQQAQIIGGVVPHAGWVYSGYEAVHFYNAIKESGQTFDTVVVVNPNHSGYGNGPFNTGDWDGWLTPLGKIEIDTDFEKLLDIEPNNLAHIGEHSGEVQLPFIQHFFNFPFKLAIITMNQQTLANAVLLASKINNAAQQTDKKVLLIASSDFSHFETPSESNRKDQLVIDEILKKDIQSIEHVVKQCKVSVCGYGPIMVLLAYSQLQNTNYTVQLLRKGNSGDTYPAEKVVGYASFLSYHNSESELSV